MNLALKTIKRFYQSINIRSGYDNYYISYRMSSLDKEGLSLISDKALDNKLLPTLHYFSKEDESIILERYLDLKWANLTDCKKFIRLESIELL